MIEPSDSQARRAAQRIGLLARKSRWRRDTVDNHGGYMLIEPYHNRVVAGCRFGSNRRRRSRAVQRGSVRSGNSPD